MRRLTQRIYSAADNSYAGPVGYRGSIACASLENETTFEDIALFNLPQSHSVLIQGRAEVSTCRTEMNKNCKASFYLLTDFQQGMISYLETRMQCVNSTGSTLSQKLTRHSVEMDHASVSLLCAQHGEDWTPSIAFAHGTHTFAA